MERYHIIDWLLLQVVSNLQPNNKTLVSLSKDIDNSFADVLLNIQL